MLCSNETCQLLEDVMIVKVEFHFKAMPGV